METIGIKPIKFLDICFDFLRIFELNMSIIIIKFGKVYLPSNH